MAMHALPLRFRIVSPNLRLHVVARCQELSLIFAIDSMSGPELQRKLGTGWHE